MTTATIAPPAKAAAQPGLFKRVFEIAKTTVLEFLDDNCLVLAGAVAYSALQSVVPLILGFIAVGSLFLQDPANKASFVRGVSDAVPSNLSSSINLNEIVDTFIKGAGSVTAISVLILLWTGSGVFGQLKYAVNVAFDVRRDKRNFFLQTGLQLFMLVVLGGLFILASVIGFLAGLIFNLKIGLFGISPYTFSFVLPLITYALPILIEAGVFAVLYRLSPARPGVHWRPVLIAGLVTALLFELLKILFGFYLQFFNAADSATKTYGAIGGVFVFLFFLYLSAAIILLGAELAAALHGFKSGDATVTTRSADVETDSQEIGNEKVPPHAAQVLKGEVISPAAPPAGTAAGAGSGGTTITSAIIGGLVIVAVAILEFLLRRRIKN